MGIFARALKSGIGWPNAGWAPPSGTIAGSSISGTPITYDSAMSVGAFAAGIRLIAEDIASLPLIVYRRLEVGKERATDHPMYRLLHDAPNPEMTSMVWRETGIGHLYSWGNWYAEKELNGLGQTVRLWPLRPDRVTVAVDPTSNRRLYRYTFADGSTVTLPAERVFHVPGFGFDGLIGYSRIHMMRRQIESAIAVEQFGLQTFANGAQPGVTILHKAQLTAVAKRNIVESWDEGHAGLSNAQRTAILDEGMTLDHLGFPPEDAQFLESRRFSVEEIARGLRLAPHKLSDMSRATFSNIEESNLDHVVGTLRPPAVRVEQQMNKDLIGDPEYFVEHLLDALLRGKAIERAQAQAIRINSGTLSPDEARALENQNPIPDGSGNVFLAPLNMSPLDQLGVPPIPAGPKAADLEDMEGRLSDLMRATKDDEPRNLSVVVNAPPVELPAASVESAMETIAAQAVSAVNDGMQTLGDRDGLRVAQFQRSTETLLAAVAALRVDLRAPRVKTVVRGTDGRIIEVREEAAS